ncbi:hypothetical protein [Cellulomonas palmilytica]|uniref:hypothetical protein n=1 Tax=Cellulomonas palmilytica TaxID=2608402 RepID=UPI001F27B776|nr:hypothetical protein [Cellulomonas palmilytica]UJP39784.1 hypothetical protein F1D97_16075 [Cellulomonas palmilytica]
MALYAIDATSERFQICDECDATWLPDAELRVPGFMHLFEIFAERGLPESWEHLIPVAQAGREGET